MVDYSIGLDTVEVDDAMKDLISRTPQLSRRILSLISESVVSRTVTHHLSGQTLNRKTGTLAKSINYKLRNDYLSKVGTNVAYAAIHEFGGIIEPKLAGALHFKIADQWITTKKVVIPKRPYLAPALEYVFTNNAQDIMNDELEVWIDKEFNV